ncbi:universal stress protein [Brachybacterium sp. DNPG3]
MSGSPSTPSTPAPVLVAVVPGQPDAVVRTAASYADRLGTHLVCAWVDTTRYTLSQLPDGSMMAIPLDPDPALDEPVAFDPDLEHQISRALDGRGVRWVTRALSGAAAQELSGLAEEIGAEMIVVGTREAGWKESLREFLTGSVAVQLSHRQHRPVVIVPLDPVCIAAGETWEPSDAKRERRGERSRGDGA